VDFAVLCEIVRARLARAGPRPVTAPDERPRLSSREVEALTWSARGKTSSEIASILGVSERTVNFHMDSAMRKLGSVTRTQAAVKASRDGLINP
jgi:DNA-binding CsgD family transcriptional regulator